VPVVPAAVALAGVCELVIRIWLPLNNACPVSLMLKIMANEAGDPAGARTIENPLLLAS
jgi:hypothetical protein